MCATASCHREESVVEVLFMKLWVDSLYFLLWKNIHIMVKASNSMISLISLNIQDKLNWYNYFCWSKVNGKKNIPVL